MKWQIKHFDCVISTNETAKDFPVHSLITARQQTGGKGRMDRIWESPVGNLYCSAVVVDCGKKTPLLSYVAGVAVALALSDYPVKLKWPNDIFLNGGKLGGILLERVEGKVIIGIGINTANAPKTKLMYPVSHLDNRISPDDLAQRIITHLDTLIEQFISFGFAPIRKHWLKLALGLGQHITVHLPTQTIGGTFTDLSPQGELVLETSDKADLKITAGDVFI